MPLYPRRVQSTATQVTVTTNDGTIWLYQDSDPVRAAKGVNPAQYKGNQTFNTLTSIRNGIASTGGWAQVPGTTMITVVLSNAEADAIAPRAVGRGNTYPDQFTTVWGSGAWNGYGFFVGAVGGHYAGWFNEFYLLRVADPVGVWRLYDPSPIGAVPDQTTKLLTDPTTWQSLNTSQVSQAIPVWGPRSTHTYDSVVWDEASQRLILGGSNQNSCLNPSQIGQLGQYEHNIWTMDVNAPTPKSAWVRTRVGGIPEVGDDGAGGIFAIVPRGNGTYNLRTAANSRFNFSPATRQLTAYTSGGPSADQYAYWRNGFRDASTGKTYEFHRADKGNPYSNPPYRQGIFESTSGSLGPLIAQLPSPAFINIIDADWGPGGVAMNGYAYCWDGNATVARVNLTTGAVDTYTDGTNVYRNQFVTPWNGTYGRWAWCPQASCFVGMCNERDNIWVFRPPAAWGL